MYPNCKGLLWGRDLSGRVLQRVLQRKNFFEKKNSEKRCVCVLVFSVISVIL